MKTLFLWTVGDTVALFVIREKLRELNNELLKKNAFIDEMEPKYNASSECGAYSMPTPLLLLFLTVSRVM